VGLGPLVENVLGLALEKGYAAADWSTRPLPEDWLRYAALDVEVLVDLRDSLAEQLVTQGKDEWARQEFAAVLSAGPPAPRAEPWRRTSGIHRVRTRRGLAIVRELWLERDRIAQRRDLSPGRVLPDSAIVEAARAAPSTAAALAGVSGFKGRGAKRHAQEWFAAIRRAHTEADQALPRPSAQISEGRRQRTAGTSGIPRRPGVWPPCGRLSLRSPTSTRCPPRTCSSPTRCAGSPGSRRTR